MKKIIDHTLIVLEKADSWMSKEEIATEIKAIFPRVNLQEVWKRLNILANIGYDSKKGYRYYEPDGLTNKVQECLDRGDDW